MCMGCVGLFARSCMCVRVRELDHGWYIYIFSRSMYIFHVYSSKIYLTDGSKTKIYYAEEFAIYIYYAVQT